MSRRRYGQRGTRTRHGIGNGTGGAGSPTWTAPFHRTPEFAEGASISASGPSSSRSMPRRSSNLKAGVVTKSREKMWASKTTGSLKHYDKATLSPNMNRLPFESTKEAGFSKEQFLSPSLSHQTHKAYPSFVKDKKAVARNLASDTTSKCAVTSGLEGLARKLTTLAPTL